MERETIEKRIAESEKTMEICKLCGNERGYKMAQDRVNSLRKQLSEKSEAIDTRPERTGKEKEELVGYCKFCGQSIMVHADETYTEDELNELATDKCTCGQAANYRWKKSVQEVYMQDVEMIFDKDEEMKDLFAMAGKMVIDGKISAISVKKSAEKTLNLKMKGSGLCIQTTEKKKTENVSYG